MDALTLAPQWQFLEDCPACHQNCKDIVGTLGMHNYVFGSRRIVLPERGVALAHCNGCGLVYKMAVPTPAFLKTVTALEQSTLWQPNYDFASEFAAIHTWHQSPAYDLLDVGAAGGEFLRAAPHGKGRRSALDIVRFDRLTVSDGGEFIRGLIDDPALDWSGEPYDVVTIFDVLEHVYAPSAAMANLSALTRPGGIVIIETGDTDAIGPAELDRWYYLAYFEHHLAWNARAIRALADRFAFDVLSIEQKRHKLLEKESFEPKALLKYHCFRLSPKIYHALQYWGGFDGSTPIKPNARDHMRIVLRRRP
jgi:SAM-dependent methyltransferase